MAGGTDLARALEAIVGTEHVRPGEAAPAYAVDGQAASLVVFPGSVEEVSRVLALAWDRRLGVAPAGAGTRLGWGGTPRRLDLVLALRRLDRVLAHEPADLTLSVEAHPRLHPMPAEEATWAFGFSSAEVALEAALTLQDTAVVPSRLQLVDRATLAAVGEPGPPGAALAVTVGSVPEAVRAQGARVAEICRRSGGEALAIADASRWWTAVSDAAWPVEPATTVLLRVGTRPSDVVKALRAGEAALLEAARLRATAEVANGVLHVV